MSQSRIVLRHLNSLKLSCIFQVETQITKNDLNESSVISSQVVPEAILNNSEVINPTPPGTSNTKLYAAVSSIKIQLDENGVDPSIEFTAASYKRMLKQGLVRLNAEVKRNRKRIHPRVNYNLDKPKHYDSMNLTSLKFRAKDGKLNNKRIYFI